jgi:uncharacterized protein
MSDAKSPDPSMEEIIASIGRMLTEDGGSRAPAAPSAAAEEDILELTEALGEDGRVRRIAAAAAPAGAAAVRPTTASQIEPSLSLSEPPRRDAEKPAESSEHDAGGIRSEERPQAASPAFARLGVPPRGRESAPGSPVGGTGRTLEEVVHEALRPLLQRWLEDHLPALAERLVREEIARLAGGASRR